MRKFLIVGLLAALAIVLVPSTADAGDKILVCHFPPHGLPEPKEISDDALSGHLGHGDFLLTSADDPCLPVQEPPSDPLVRVCLDGEVSSILTSLQVSLDLTVLGDEEGCPDTSEPFEPVTVCYRSGFTATAITVAELEAYLEADATLGACLPDDPIVTDTDGTVVTEVVVDSTPAPVVTSSLTVTFSLVDDATTDIGTFVPGPDGVHGGPAPGQVEGPAPLQELPRTGSGSMLALLGSGLASGGMLLRKLAR